MRWRDKHRVDQHERTEQAWLVQRRPQWHDRTDGVTNAHHGPEPALMQGAAQVLAEWPPIAYGRRVRIRPERPQQHADDMVFGGQQVDQWPVTGWRVAVGVQEVQSGTRAAKIKRRNEGRSRARFRS